VVNQKFVYEFNEAFDIPSGPKGRVSGLRFGTAEAAP
jgi:hypothetical protein